MAAAAPSQGHFTLSRDLIRSYLEDLVPRAKGWQLKACMKTSDLMTPSLAAIKWNNVLIARDAFLKAVSSALDSEHDQGNAAASLSYLTTEYLDQFALPSEAIQRLKAGHEALMRADLFAARRELKYASNKGAFLRKHSATMLFFLCSDEESRERACRLVPLKDLRRAPDASNLSRASFAFDVAPRQPVLVAAGDSPTEPPRAYASFIEELGRDIAPNSGPREQSWRIDEIAGALHIQQVPLWDFDEKKQIADAMVFLQSVRSELAADPDNSAQVLALLSLFDAWAQTASALGVPLRANIDQVKSFVLAGLTALPDLYADSVCTVKRLLETDAELAQVRDGYNKIANSFNAAQSAQSRTAKELAHEIEDQAANLQSSNASRLRLIVQGLLEQSRSEDLRRVLVGTEREVGRLSELLMRQQKALDVVRGGVHSIDSDDLDDETRSILSKAVHDGDSAAVEHLLAAATGRHVREERALHLVLPTRPSEATSIGDGPDTPARPSTIKEVEESVPAEHWLGAAQSNAAIRTQLPDDVPAPDLEDVPVQLQPRNAEAEALGLPPTARAAARTLLGRALVEIKRGSVIGALDNSLDILALAGKSGDSTGSCLWSAVAVLASVPADPASEEDWQEQCYEDICGFLRADTHDLARPFRNLLAYDQFDDALRARFAYDDFLPFARELGTALYVAASRSPGEKLLDVAAAIGRATTANPKLGIALISAMADAAGCPIDLATIVDELRPRGVTRRKLAQPTEMPDWLWAGVEPLASDREPVKTQNRAALKLCNVHVQLIPSLQARGGRYDSRSKLLELALYVSVVSEAPLAAAELSFSRANNPWLIEESIVSLNGVEKGSPVIVPLRLRTESLTGGTTLRLEFKLRTKTHARPCRTRLQSDSVPVLVSDATGIDIKGYGGAAGLPLVLVGDDLKYSSGSVRAALAELRERLLAGPYFARLVGRRRRGKTSILFTLKEDPEIQHLYTVVYYPVQTRQALNLDEAMSEVGSMLDKAARKLNLDLDSIENRLKDSARPWSIVDEWIEKSESHLKSSASVLLLVDEFQKLLSKLSLPDRNTILALFRGLKDRPRSSRLSFSIVLSGLTSINKYSNACKDFEVGFPIHAVETFSDSEVGTLLRSNESITYDSRAVAAIRELAGGNPFLVNLLGDRGCATSE